MFETLNLRLTYADYNAMIGATLLSCTEQSFAQVRDGYRADAETKLNVAEARLLLLFET